MKAKQEITPNDGLCSSEGRILTSGKLLLIDGNSLINRSFYAIRLLSNKKGVYTNAITGFFSAFLKLQNELKPTHAAIAFDLRAPTFRHKMYDGYKKRRKGMPEELAAQMPYIKQILDYMGIARVECEGYEADDIIGTLARSAASDESENLVYIATGDRDSFQLIDEQISVCLASNKEEIIYTPKKIEELYGIAPKQFIEIKALMGDSSDDIPGVAGIGEKTAFSLIQKFETVDYIYEHLAGLDVTTLVRTKLSRGKELCFLSRELGRIKTDVPIDLSLNSYIPQKGNPAQLATLLTELELATLMKRLKLQPVELPALSDVSQNEPQKNEADNDQTNDHPYEHLQVDNDLERVLRDMENTGIKVDAEGIRKFGEELEPQINALESRIHEMAGVQFNILSPKQLSEILFEGLGLSGTKKTKTGYSTGAEVLEALADEHPIIPLITEYRELTKLNSTYVQGLLKCVKDNGRIHTTFKNETRTGRLSSVEPNIQNIPVRTERGRIFRRFFIAERGCLLVDADYSQIELRVLAHVSSDSIMLDAFRNNADIHTITAAQVFGVAEKNVTREMRSAAKAVNFGIVYGMGAFSLSKEIGVSVAQAKDYIERYLKKYNGVREYLERVTEEAKNCGYVKTLLGRTRNIPELRSSNHNIRASGERIAKNTPIQGTAADIIKIAMVRVYDRLIKEQPSAKLILQVHDELIVESPEQIADKTAKILSEEMISAGRELEMNLTVDVKTGSSWYETH
ncbi:MAG: DNA polymerase [Oscillospiraceae bacterium]|nr:DNA polymerase [Oscillospiraceae bacterium]